MISATAPGKLILFGEHAVVYGRPALAIPLLQVGVTVMIELAGPDPASSHSSTSDSQNWLEHISITAPDIGRYGTLASYASKPEPDPIAAAIGNLFSALGVTTPPAMRIHITSSIPVASGLGSGAAVSVALIRALATSLGKTLSDEQVNQLAFETEKLYHGTPSGIDNTVITYARPVYFVKNLPLETFSVGAPFTLVIADSGIIAATHESVGDVRKLWQAEPVRLEKIFSSIANIVDQARLAIQTGDINFLGPLMNQNHSLLQELTVSSPELDRLTAAALSCGALGAKLSGGGRGGNMIALVQPETAPAIAVALRDAGARGTIITQVS
ncbi:MAG: mevalonate kinase [Chloroflexi bacterium GWB2_49_20]|nr:MAG: mevalonate kinase [Chloroflexi bacterium GWB2_49_20]OGN79866.1 MAG: mevalonate kinase [Chloroflexi bacterium GWC2_49_37]OGN85599.1 MAG: mevalonate kinase [Chloroflexi bacterium GWD2_49_16]